MSQRGKQASNNWDAYERGRTSSIGSLDSVPEDAAQHVLSSSAGSAPWDITGIDDKQLDQDLRRRSSLTRRFSSIRQMGGPNSIDNSARSFQRAAGFRQIMQIRRGSISGPAVADGDSDEEAISNDEGPSV